MADVREKVVEFPSSVREAYDKYLAAKTAEAHAKKEKEGLFSFIIQSVPRSETDEENRVFGVQDGVKVLAFDKTSMKWKQALTEIVNTLVPHTRLPKAERIIRKFSSTKENYTVTDMED